MTPSLIKSLKQVTFADHEKKEKGKAKEILSGAIKALGKAVSEQ